MADATLRKLLIGPSAQKPTWLVNRWRPDMQLCKRWSFTNKSTDLIGLMTLSICASICVTLTLGIKTEVPRFFSQSFLGFTTWSILLNLTTLYSVSVTNLVNRLNKHLLKFSDLFYLLIRATHHFTHADILICASQALPWIFLIAFFIFWSSFVTPVQAHNFSTAPPVFFDWIPSMSRSRMNQTIKPLQPLSLKDRQSWLLALQNTWLGTLVNPYFRETKIIVLDA